MPFGRLVIQALTCHHSSIATPVVRMLSCRPLYQLQSLKAAGSVVALPIFGLPRLAQVCVGGRSASGSIALGDVGRSSACWPLQSTITISRLQ